MNLERHFVNRIRQQAKTRQNATALRHKINGLWKDISWNSFQQQLDQLSLAFLAWQIKRWMIYSRSSTPLAQQVNRKA